MDAAVRAPGRQPVEITGRRVHLVIVRGRGKVEVFLNKVPVPPLGSFAAQKFQ
jgi:hypothetical protein